MSLRVVVATPFVQDGRNRLRESEFVVSLSLDRDWFSPDQAKRLIDVATGEGLLERDDAELVCPFDPSTVTIPDGFEPDENVLTERSAFERVLDAVVDAGIDKQTAVGTINGLQQELDIHIEAAAVLYARRNGIDVTELTSSARSTVIDGR